MEHSKNKFGFKNVAIIALFVAAAVLSAVFMGKVAVNYNLADYLDKDTQTKIALDIVENEFGMTSSVQVMVKDVSTDTAEEIRDKIEDVEHVLNVNFDKYDETYYKDGNALFVAVIDGDDYSENAKQVVKDIKSALASYETEYGGTATEKQNLQDAITSEMGYILAISLCLVAAILLITSESWLEPIVLLAASGVAVLINRGTNVFFGEISYITNSISAILQLALSVDYSIVLLHAYRREKQSGLEPSAAMKKAVRSVIKPVSASALTTVAGLLALLFMSFRIGFDIGIVLMKGIVISAITSLTLLPSLVLLLDGPLKRTTKKAFTPKGEMFCKTAYKASKIIVPVALAVIIACGCLQTGNTYIFSDSSAGNQAIGETFGNNNSVVAVYKNSDDNLANEKKFADAVNAYRTADGKQVLSYYTAYSNTVKEAYDVEKAVRKLELSENETEMLFTMYHLYGAPDKVTMTFAEFVDFADRLVNEDEDAVAFADKNTIRALNKLQTLSYVTANELTANRMYECLTAVDEENSDISLFAVKQIYGLYFYDQIENSDVCWQTMLDFAADADNIDSEAGFDAETLVQLQQLSQGVAQFVTQVTMPMDKTSVKGWFYQNAGVVLTDEQLEQIWSGYFASTQQTRQDTIPYLPLMKFLVTSGQITDQTTVATVNKYDTLYQTVTASYGYESFLPVLSAVATALTETTPQITATNDTVKQLYVMYFYAEDKMPAGTMNGVTFAQFAIDTAKTDEVVRAQLTVDAENKLADIITTGKYVADTTNLTYETAYDKLVALQKEIKSDISMSIPGKDEISGVFVKYATNNGAALTEQITACDLLDFVTDNMDSNTLLIKKMSDDNRSKVADAQKDIQKATDLFCGKEYSRMLLSVNLPNESDDTTKFIEYLSDEVKTIFGDNAYVTGEIVSVYDLEKSFDHDNLFITVFTLVAIFVIVAVIFKSLSLPLILVAVIQGAIFIAMSTQLAGNGIFFMSYIVSTCILMGATIDYGILMSSNYVASRSKYDKKTALELSVQTAMPTVFTSGTILTVCGFVIHFISSQNSISTVGLLIGIGTVCSAVMITVVLPSVLYLLDKFVLKLSLKKRSSDNATAEENTEKA